MERLKRRETRYFFPSIRLLEILTVVRSILGQEILHKFPVTETIYFTLGREYGYAFPHNTRVRARSYIASITNNVLIDNSLVFLEIKEEISGGMNCKSRIEGEALKIVEMLGRPNGINGLPKLSPYAVTQSLRYHWIIGEHGRLTLDQDIRLFGFKNSDSFEAELVCDFGDGKLEFKSRDETDLPVETKIVENTGCISREYTYLERRTRQCMQTWLNQKRD